MVTGKVIANGICTRALNRWPSPPTHRRRHGPTFRRRRGRPGLASGTDDWPYRCSALVAQQSLTQG